VPEVEVVEHDFDEPLPDVGTFDAVVSAFAIHHVVDARKRALYGEVYERLAPNGVFLNLEHVDSPTPELHTAFLDAIGYGEIGDDPSNKLVAVETQLAWLRDIGFAHVDCHWKWRELALLAGVKPGG
jgi:SAM-dependent methyltransferase